MRYTQLENHRHYQAVYLEGSTTYRILSAISTQTLSPTSSTYSYMKFAHKKKRQKAYTVNKRTLTASA